MVNNKGILIEVKKPVETVYELKNEIPSFEEFMKDYQADENLNYGDLGSGGIGTQKGYGPCIDGRDKNYCYCSREELQNQISSLQSQLTTAVSSQNITNINVIQVKINSIIEIIKVRSETSDQNPYRSNVSASFKFDKRVNTAFWPWNEDIQYRDVWTVRFVTNNSSILDVAGGYVYWNSIDDWIASQIGYHYCTQKISLHRIEQIRKFRDILGSGISVYRWGLGGAAYAHRGSLENKMRECLNRVTGKWERGESLSEIGGSYSITIDTDDL